MQINGTGPIQGAERIDPTHATRSTEQATLPSGVGGSDEVSISQEAHLLSRINEMPDIRQDLVDQARAEIASGTYESQEKLDIAVANLLDEIA
jgi:negative regulator of flagellin synthesis FlgM